MPYDVDAARKAGLTDEDILTHLTKTRRYDVEGARKAGLTDQDIITHLSTTAPPVKAPTEPVPTRVRDIPYVESIPPEADPMAKMPGVLARLSGGAVPYAEIGRAHV